MSGVLYVVVRIGTDRYAIDSSHVIEIISLVRLKTLPGAPSGVAGVMNYRSSAIPVVDLNRLALGEDTPVLLGTRIVVANINGATLGLLVAEAAEIIRLEPGEFVSPGLDLVSTRYLGPVVTTADGVVQRVDLGELLTPEIRDAIERAREAA